MSGPFKLKYKNSAFPFKDIKGLKLNLPKKSKLKLGGFFEGGGSKGEHKIIAGTEFGFKGKHGHISLKPTILSERGKYHSITKPDIKLSVGFSPSQIWKNIRKKRKG